ncbi:GNAT family N-acetyltransferase [Virgibacillus necropolis]|uniref:Alanine acetyltransferase n=1 Tax=Virgibacillus necropolis TaxID=163877 RepID=A0A221M8D5_9BACI|nr:GNAT family N-acetyltransferase [Virgibacillus necropolis]ASN03890.1 alanine acetyltransferase [Virgibacillus necropolis]
MSIEAIFTTIPRLVTEQYMLRGLTIDDAAELFTFVSDKETMKFVTPHPVQTEAEMREIIYMQLERYNDRREIPWVIVNNKNGEIVGQFHFHKLNLWHKKADIGAIIRKEYQNNGVMTEILRQVLAFGFETLGLNRIVGDTFAGNNGSKKILNKYGFTKEGVLRQTDFDGEKYHDTVVYSIMKSEYIR